MPWGAAIAVGGAVLGSAISADASRSAANKQADASAAANQTQQDQYNQTRQDNMPALEARNASLSRLQDLLGISNNKSASGYGSLGGQVSAGDVQNEAGYQFGLQQGQSGLNKQLAARGMLNSGAALKAASRYANDYATTKYDNAYNRALSNRNQQLNALQSVAGLGQTGANTIGAAGTNYANNVSSNQTSLGNALGASSVANGNTWANTANQLGGWYSNYAQRNGGGGSSDPWGGAYDAFNNPDNYG